MSPASAGPSRTQSCKSPPPLAQDDPAASREARAYVSRRSKFLPFFRPAGKVNSKDSRNLKRHERDAARDQDFLPTMDYMTADPGLVQLNDRLLSQLPDGQDANAPQYRWAIIYENQRGATFFSTQNYSPASLLPLDPPPYTLPTSKASRRAWRAQPAVSLASYPLPDGTWRWVSRTWMIDMRGDGEVQYDGFEYAWSFRSRKWRPRVGLLSAGGWVRRRRWVRLMVKGSNLRPDAERAGREVEGEREEGEMQDAGTGKSPGAMTSHEHVGATRPPSVASSTEDEQEGDVLVWRGDEGDWDRCHVALRRLRRDGKKLELWKSWFGFGFESERRERQSSPIAEEYGLESDDEADRNSKGKVKARQYEVSSTSLSDASQNNQLAADTGVATVDAPREYIEAVLQSHGSDILHSFVFPDSRAQFMEILDAAGLIDALKRGMGISDDADVVDFWSYGHRMESLRDADATEFAEG